MFAAILTYQPPRMEINMAILTLGLMAVAAMVALHVHVLVAHSKQIAALQAQVLLHDGVHQSAARVIDALLARTAFLTREIRALNRDRLPWEDSGGEVN